MTTQSPLTQPPGAPKAGPQPFFGSAGGTDVKPPGESRIPYSHQVLVGGILLAGLAITATLAHHERMEEIQRGSGLVTPAGIGDFSKSAWVMAGGSLISLLIAGCGFSVVAIRFHARRLIEELRRSDERWKLAVDATGDGVWDWNAVTNEVKFSEKWKQILGYGDGEIVPHVNEWRQWVHPEDLPGTMAAVAAHLAGETGSYVREHRVRCKDGSWKWILGRGTVVARDASGKPLRVVGTQTDITARKLTEAALQESNYFLQKAHEIARIGSYKFDIAGGRWTSSPQLDEIFGIDESYERDLPGWINLLAPSHREEMTAYLRDHVLGRRKRFDKEYPVIRPADGQQCWVYGAGELEFDAAGQPRLMIGTIQDITQPRKSEQALRESENNLQEAQKLAGIGSWRVEFTADGEHWSASPELRRIYGGSGEVPLAINAWFEAVHPDDRDMVEAAWQQFLRGKSPGNCEHRIVVGGRTKWVCVRASIRLDPATGRPAQIAGTSQDITELKLTQADNARLVTAVAQAVETIVITDTGGTIVYANPAFEKTSGYTCAEAIGNNPRMLKSGLQDARQYRELWDCLRRGEVWSGHFVNRRKDGSLYEEEATISPVRDSAGQIVNYVAVKRDVTHEVLLESQFRQAQKMEAVGQLAGGVAHDFNNILAAVMMHIGLLQLETSLDAPTQTSLKELSKEIQRGAGLTRQLLAFSRQQAMEPRQLDVHAVVTGLLKMLRRLLGENIAVELGAATEAALVEADEGMIEQVVINLCINSRDAMPRGGRLTLRTEVIVIPQTVAPEPGGMRPGRFVRLSITDTGTGMSPETLQHVFEPFFTTKEKGKGTGLGLATVYGIVQQHRGWVTVDSTVGRGTTFQVHLPVCEADGERAKATEAAVPGRGRNELILVVEDEASLRTTVATTLRRHGYRVLEAADGPAAMALWRQDTSNIELVLTDMVMPGGMSGHELIERMLWDKPGLKFIATTGYSPQDPRIHSTLDNRIVVLGKPFDPPRLLTAVRARLDQT